MNSSAKHALLVLNGEPPSSALLRRLVRNVDLIVAADGGANVLRQHNISPDTIIGDFDSITPATKRRFRNSCFLESNDQHSTDFEKAFRYLIKKKIPRISVLGMAGMRIDFTLGNFVSLWRFVRKLDISIFGDHWSAFPVRERLRLPLPVGTTVSLVPFGRCTGVSLQGFRYPLRQATLTQTSLAVSNQTVRKNTTIRCSSGKLLAVALTE